MKPLDPVRVPPRRGEELREDFEAVDEDQDGRIDFGEFTVLMDDLDPGMSAAVLRIGFGEIDTDHDGRISLAEFIAWRR
jgi:Ca2+-binding EF-hand superfamily protein